MCIKIIFSCQADYQGISLHEILNINAPIKFIMWIDGGAGLLEYAGTFAEFSGLIREKRLIFVRHIFPAEYIIPYMDIIDIFIDIEKQSQIGELIFIRDFIRRMDKGKSFSVQIRAANDNKSYEPSEIKQKISDYFKSGGFIENKRYPEQIITVFISDDSAYVGLSQAEENLSIWSGGMRHYAMREDTISRAGFKLMEAFEAYPIVFRKDSVALDLGAAPGGWTKVLIDNGLRVVAVDPVPLSPLLQKNENVEFYNGRAHDYIKKSNRTFDLIVNDMSMNIMTSINFVLSLKHRLRGRGHVIITFKLTKHDRLSKIKDGIKLLSKDFDVVFIKQLFHNRSEITVIFQKN